VSSDVVGVVGLLLDLQGLTLGGGVCCVGTVTKEHVLSLVRLGCRRLLLNPLAQGVLEALRKRTLQQEDAGDGQLSAGLQALQMVGVPRKLCTETGAYLLHAVWPQEGSALKDQGGAAGP
jgi:hypothetical protein